MTTRQLHQDSYLIIALGGTAECAKRFNCSRQKVNQWRYRGIPARSLLDNPRIWAKARRLAKERQNDISNIII